MRGRMSVNDDFIANRTRGCPSVRGYKVHPDPRTIATFFVVIIIQWADEGLVLVDFVGLGKRHCGRSSKTGLIENLGYWSVSRNSGRRVFVVVWWETVLHFIFAFLWMNFFVLFLSLCVCVCLLFTKRIVFLCSLLSLWTLSFSIHLFSATTNNNHNKNNNNYNNIRRFDLDLFYLIYENKNDKL